jgi:hypothetical protein
MLHPDRKTNSSNPPSSPHPPHLPTDGAGGLCMPQLWAMSPTRARKLHGDLGGYFTQPLNLQKLTKVE